MPPFFWNQLQRKSRDYCRQLIILSQQRHLSHDKTYTLQVICPPRDSLQSRSMNAIKHRCSIFKSILQEKCFQCQAQDSFCQQLVQFSSRDLSSTMQHRCRILESIRGTRSLFQCELARISFSYAIFLNYVYLTVSVNITFTVKKKRKRIQFSYLTLQTFQF